MWATLAVLARRLPPGLARDLATVLPACVTTARRLRRDARVPRAAKAAVAFAALWAVSPIDLVPEFLPVIGPLDDVVVVALALRFAARRVPRAALEEAWPADRRLLDRLIGAERSSDVRLEQPVGAPVDDVWAALADPTPWWPGTTLDGRLGGRFEERWTDDGGTAVVTSGEVLGWDPPRRVRLSWRDDNWPAEASTEVTVELSATSASATVVRVGHTGWASHPDGATLVPMHEQGWALHLADLARFLARTTSQTAPGEPG